MLKSSGSVYYAHTSQPNVVLLSKSMLKISTIILRQLSWIKRNEGKFFLNNERKEEQEKSKVCRLKEASKRRNKKKENESERKRKPRGRKKREMNLKKNK